MIKAAIEKIVDLSAPDYYARPDGRTFTSKQVFPLFDAIPATLAGSTLTAMNDFIKTEPFDGGSFLHIESFRAVSLVSQIFGPHKQRSKFMTVTHEVKEFQYGRYLPIDEFIVGIQTFFIQDENTAAILKITGNVTHEATMKVMDDGVTQTVAAKTGIARVENVPVPNPVALRPYRTFLDVDHQPSCLFVFRMKQSDKGPECALFEADSGLWKLDAIAQIKAWLADNIENKAIRVVG